MSYCCVDHRELHIEILKYWLGERPNEREKFHADRIRMFVGISLLGNFEITCSPLLYGFANFDLETKKKLFGCVHLFIDSSGRL